MSIDNSIWINQFPKNYKPRSIQQKAISFAIQNFQLGKKYVILQAPTGTGKSHIAITLANYFNALDKKKKTYILTTQLILQDQYKRQFSNAANISSRANYYCTTYNDGSSCADMKWLHLYCGLQQCSNCPYQKAKFKFVSNHVSITNTAFFLSNLQYNQQLIADRHLLIVDQCHNLQQDIIRFKGITLDYQFMKREYSYPEQLWCKKQDNHYVWVQKVFRQWLASKKSQYIEVLQRQQSAFSRSKLVDVSKKYDYLDKLMCQLNRMSALYSKSRWVVDFDKQKLGVKITPIYASDFANQVLFRKANHVLLMSGTILNKDVYCQNLGIPKQQCVFLSLDSPFLKQCRPIYLTKTGSMSKKNIEVSFPNLISDIRKILSIHSGQKGIIHVSSHRLASDIANSVGSNRLAIVEDFKNRNQMLQHHFDSNADSVLISPSLMQGVDLKDQLSRFQIIAKVPFPNLGDKYISVKKDLLPKWYAYQTAKTIVQSYGRSVRNENDYAVTYILDSDFQWFLKYNNNMFPKYFKEAISYGKI